MSCIIQVDLVYLEIKATEECTGTLDLQERMESLVYLETKVA